MCFSKKSISLIFLRSIPDYVKIIEEESNKLKAKGANAIIVIGHLGLYCRNDPDEVKLEYKYSSKKQ